MNEIYDAFNTNNNNHNNNDFTFDRFNFSQQQQQQQQMPYIDDTFMLQLLMQQQQQQQSFYQHDQTPSQIITKCFLCNSKISSTNGCLINEDNTNNNNSELISYQTNKLCINCAQNIAYQHHEQLPL